MKLMTMTMSMSVLLLLVHGAVAADAVRVGVYVGEGTAGLGAPRWAEIVHRSPQLEEVLVDAVAVTNGTLETCEALILPHGGVEAMAAALGESGLAAIRAFVEKGGNCLASDGGARLLTPGSLGRQRVSVLPFGEGEGYGVGVTDELQADFIPELAGTYGLRRAERRRLAWEGGVPFALLCLEPGELSEKANFKVAAELRGNLNLLPDARKTLRGQIVDVCGTYGKGRVWATMMHSEFTPANVDVTKMQLEYVLGQKVEWQLPQRTQGQLAVAVIVDGSLGVAGMSELLRLADDPDFDVCVVTERDYDGFWKRHVDATVKAAELRAGTVNPRLRLLKASPLVPPKVLAREKVEKPVKAVLYCGPGVGDSELFNFATILDDSPKYTVECQDGSKFGAGSLKGFDFLLVAGGYTGRIYDALAPSRSAIIDFLFSGGTYYGACAGSFVTLQSPTGLGLVPFSPRNSPYRGHSHPTVAFTEEAAAWGLDGRVHEALYWGGPEFVPGKPIDDCEVKVLAHFNCDTIDTFGNNGMPMKDWPAVLGGRLGKGRIVSTSVHPEEDETQFYLVYGGLRYLHGEQPKPNPINRCRGALTVGYFMPFEVSASMMQFALDLRRDTRFDVRPQSEHMDISGYARHLDVYVFGNGFKSGRFMAETEEYLRRGGRAIFVSANPAERNRILALTKGFAAVSVVATHEEAKALLDEMVLKGGSK